MITVVIFSGEEAEREDMEKTFHTLGARLTEDKWNIRAFDRVEAAEASLREHPLADLLCCDAGTMEALVRLRALCRDSRLLVVADETTSPLQYLRPQIMASSLLLRPYTGQEMNRVLKEFVETYLEARPDEGENLVVKTREGRTVIPCKQVYYLEAREKKLFVRVAGEEYAIYETLDSVMKRLEGKFLRVHRGFAVNPKRIERVSLSDGLILLRDGFQIPLSRSYKGEVKEFLK